MDIQQQQHSYVQKQGNQFVNNAVTSHLTSGTRSIGFTKVVTLDNTTSNAWMLPLFNTFFIDIGTGVSQRSSNSIYVHRIECSYTIIEDAANNIGPDETIANSNSSASATCMTDPRFRVMVVTPKQQYRFLPTSGTITTPVFPFFNSTMGGTVYEPISSPILFDSANDWGMQALPDPQYYNCDYDDVKNLCTGKIGFDSGSFSFLVRKQFDYMPVIAGGISCNDNEIQSLIPQIWFFQAAQLKGGDFTTKNAAKFNFSFSVRMIYDVKN